MADPIQDVKKAASAAGKAMYAESKAEVESVVTRRPWRTVAIFVSIVLVAAIAVVVALS